MAKTTELVDINVDDLKPYERNAKLHPHDQIEKIKASIREFGFLSPCLIDKDQNIIAGHGRVTAAKELGMKTVPCIYIEGLTEEQRRAYILADNKLTELGGWDEYIVHEELTSLLQAGFDIDLTGFNLEDITGAEIPESADKINPTLLLPESRVFIFSVSAFGTNSETLLAAHLPQETADKVLEAMKKGTGADILNKIMEALNDI